MIPIKPIKFDNYKYLFEWMSLGIVFFGTAALWFYVWYATKGCTYKCPEFKPPILIGCGILSYFFFVYFNSLSKKL